MRKKNNTARLLASTPKKLPDNHQARCLIVHTQGTPSSKVDMNPTKDALYGAQSCMAVINPPEALIHTPPSQPPIAPKSTSCVRALGVDKTMSLWVNSIRKHTLHWNTEPLVQCNPVYQTLHHFNPDFEGI